MPQLPVRRPAAVSRPQQTFRRPPPAGARKPGQPGNARPAARRSEGRPGGKVGAAQADHEILFQQYFKSVNPQRTYAVQLKRANNGNHFLVLTEGKRDEGTGEVRKTRLFVYSEDFIEYFKLLQAAAQFIRANPVPDDVKKKRVRYWDKKASEPAGIPRPAAAAVAVAAPSAPQSSAPKLSAPKPSGG